VPGSESELERPVVETCWGLSLRAVKLLLAVLTLLVGILSADDVAALLS
jgi:hypothetical protein